MLEEIYDDIFSHVKETAGLPVFYHQLSRAQEYFFRDLFEKIGYDIETNKKELVEDLNLIKSDLEAVIAIVEK